MAKKDPVKEIFGKSAKEIFAEKPQDHAAFHSPNAFCGYAGPEEMAHLAWLTGQLTDDEIVSLVDAVGIKYHNTKTGDIEREVLESVLDEADREIFYREWHKIMNSRKLN